MLKSNNSSIEVSPKFAALFTESQMVSSKMYSLLLSILAKKGRSHMLLNREKKFKRIEDQKEAQNKHDESESLIAKLSLEVENLKDELVRRDMEKDENDKNRDILGRLFEQNIIDEDGTLL
jgi:hypothetical protein